MTGCSHVVWTPRGVDDVFLGAFTDSVVSSVLLWFTVDINPACFLTSADLKSCGDSDRATAAFLCCQFYWRDPRLQEWTRPPSSCFSSERKHSRLKEVNTLTRLGRKSKSNPEILSDLKP